MTTKKIVLTIIAMAIPLGFLLYPFGYLMLTGCAQPNYQPPPAMAIPEYKDLFSFEKSSIPEAKKAAPAQFFDDRFVRQLNSAR